MSRWAVDREYAPRQAVGLCRFGELFSWFPDTGIISADAEQTQAKLRLKGLVCRTSLWPCLGIL